MTVDVLLVDDQVPFRLAAADVLAATAGFRLVATVGTGEEAVETAVRLRPGLILMDVHLPGIDGLEATRRITAALPSTAVLLVSTYPAGDFAPEVRACGAAGYLQKSSFAPDRLTALWADLGGARPCGRTSADG